MSTLWKDVVEGALDTQDTEKKDFAAIEAMVTEDPSTMVEYVAGCTEGMVALEAAVAMAEGRCAVKYITATEESAKDEAKATMEGVLADAWDTLKEWAEKAWEAIKKFIKKAWNKMKGYANVVKAFFSKYGQVIKGKNVEFDVPWCDIQLDKGLSTATSLLSEVMRLTSDDVKKHEVTGSGAGQSNQQYYDALHNAFFKNGDESNHDEKWSVVKPKAIKVADQGLDSLYQGMFKLGDKSERDMIKSIRDTMKSDQAYYEKNHKDDDDRSSNRSFISKKTRIAVYVVRQMASMGHRAATRLYNQSVKACRMAIRQEAESSSATFGVESASNLDAFMSEIL